MIHCQLLEEEGRARAARVAHAMASRAVLEMLAALASPSQLSTSLWAAVRTRGCQFLGPGENINTDINFMLIEII